MRVTPLNVARFWKRLMFPPHKDEMYADRLALRGDLPWEPWVHCSVWLSIIAVLFVGEQGVYPPFDDMDWAWIFFGLISPPIGFASVWMLEFHSGKIRYVALWLRMLSDAGLVSTLVFYQWERVQDHGLEAIGYGHGVVANILLMFAMWYMCVLVWRDIQFIIATERLAAAIYYNVRVTATNFDRMEDAN